jgi:sec-independent protein translocase protein TatB
MLDVGWMELLIIGVVALIVIGPKDLPEMFRTLGRFTAKLRAMGREFQRAMETAAKESGVKDVAKDLNTVMSPKNTGLDAVKSAADKFEKWDPLGTSGKGSKPLTPPPMPAPVSAPAPATVAAAAPAAEAAAAAPVSSATAALYDKRAARKAVLDEAAGKLRAIADPAPVTEAVTAPAKKPGRTRKKAVATDGDAA